MDAEPRRLCAFCRTRPAEQAWRPFCSERCKLLDLARWLDGDYRIAGEPALPGGSPDDEPPDTDAGES